MVPMRRATGQRHDRHDPCVRRNGAPRPLYRLRRRIPPDEFANSSPIRHEPMMPRSVAAAPSRRAIRATKTMHAPGEPDACDMSMQLAD